MTEFRFAGFWRRVGAMIIDRIILYIIFVMFVMAAAAALTLNLSENQVSDLINDFSETAGLYLAIYIVMTKSIDMVYFTYFHGAGGQTPGKIVFGVRVVALNGDSISFGTAFLRWVGYIISAIFLLLGFIWVAFDPKKQGWHDKIAGTVVIRTRTQPILQKEEEPEGEEKYLDKENDVL